MARLDRKARTPNSLVASAEVLAATRINPPQNLAWQANSWGFYYSVGEFRRGVDWIASACSRCRLIAAERPIGSDDEPVPLDSGPAVDAVAEFAGGVGGQAALIEMAATHLGVVGETFYVGYDDDSGRHWEAHSADEIRPRGDGFELRKDDNSWIPVDMVVRVWNPDKRFSWRADAQTRTLAPILREIELSTEYIQSALISRLAGAGLLILPDEIVFPGSDKHQGEDGDPFVLDLIEAMVTPIKDSNSASRHVPMVIRVPGAFVDKVKHLRFAAPFDEKAIDQRDNAIGRLAVSMDLETEQLTGMGEVNHWGQWEIKESTLQMTVAPRMESICNGLTTGWLKSVLGATGARPDNEIIVWYDTTELDVKPDKSQHAQDAYDRGEASGAAYRRELGLSEDDAPTGEELLGWAARRLLLNPETAAAAAQALGLTALDTPALTPAPAPAVPPPAQEEPPADGPPQDGEAPDPAEEQLSAALVEACDALVERALERSGNRLKQVSKSVRISCAARDAHCAINARTVPQLRDGYLLGDAWDRVPQVAQRHGVDSARLSKALHAYCEGLIEAQRSHHIADLTTYLRSEPWLTRNG